MTLYNMFNHGHLLLFWKPRPAPCIGAGTTRLEGMPVANTGFCLPLRLWWFLAVTVAIFWNILLTYSDCQGRGCTTMASSSSLSSKDMRSCIFNHGQPLCSLLFGKLLVHHHSGQPLSPSSAEKLHRNTVIPCPRVDSLIHSLLMFMLSPSLSPPPSHVYG